MTNSVIACRIKYDLKMGIKQFQQKYHLKTETEAITRLLHAGLFVEQKKEELQDPAMVKFLQENLYNQQLVDWIYELPQDRLDALFGAFRSAREWRLKR